ncbi:hypothetical protein DUNSADRAFT_747 [Dunaliella salina]|uniref:Encoded protein n=1 Tax=Dunaliella salina TaxID=3046 RepID=A0ABQ7GXY4_DUNSA|nr:hypothetical protein DUNSADRAFT_747 [Dunaliella salina]|eukprot:KAF5839461.1 hypothetical protein DUNSADRAFT_747 [Dunaliella salina]
MSKAHGSPGMQTPRRLVGPERASIRMLNGSSGQGDHSSAEACETGGPSCSGAAAGGQKFGLLASVSQRLNEMSPSRPRPPTPIGSNEEAGAVMAHLAPMRRSHSRFASPSKADSLANRMTSKSSSFALPSYTSQNHKAGSPHATAPHEQPFSDAPEDLDAPGPSLGPLGSPRPVSGSESPEQATHCVSFSDYPHGNAAPKQGSEKHTSSHP